MSMLDRKLARDLSLWRGQIIAIAAVAACGIMSFVTMQSNYDSMFRAQADYYSVYRFADLFANVTRAPRTLARQIAAISNVERLQTRVVADVLADIPGRSDPASVRLISIPNGRQPELNRIYLRSGRLPAPDSRNEAVVSAAFSQANRLGDGSSLSVTINGRIQRLRIVGIGLSPEYVYEMRGGADLFPDSRHFGVVWMNDAPLAAAFDMTDGFNDVSVALARGANEAATVEAMDRVLAPYGSLGAFGRSDQLSARFVANELGQLRAQAIVIPLMFLGIASFLINSALARLIATQREQIAVLKAFGFGNARIGLHYAEAALVAVAGGSIVGVGGGWWMGYRLALLYTNFFRFPHAAFTLDAWIIVVAIAISILAATAGALSSVFRAAALPPAEAMRAPSPRSYRATFLERLGIARAFAPAVLIVIRTIERRPVASFVTVFALSLAVAILVVGRSTYDSVEHMMKVQFEEVSREDATIFFDRPVNARARFEIRSLPGVLASEPYRAVYVRVRHAHRSRRLALVGVPDHPQLHRIVDGSGSAVDPPFGGAVMTAALARILDVTAGDTVKVSFLEGRRRTVTLRIDSIVDELIGLNVYVRASRLHAMLDEDASLSGAYVRLDPKKIDAFDAAVKATPKISGVGYRAAALGGFKRSFSESIGISAAFIFGFALVIACGVVYNSGRVALSERARELSTLRILGYGLREVSLMFVGEQALLTFAAVPVGFVVGNLLNHALQPLYELEYYRVPLLTTRISYVIAAAFTIGAAALSAGLLSLQLRRMNVVEALKARE